MNSGRFKKTLEVVPGERHGHRVVVTFGYGVFRERGRQLRANRVALQLAGTELSRVQTACHRCDNPACVNPDHLYAGTQQTNAHDRESRKRGGGPKRRGEGNGRAKLSEEQVAEVRALYATGKHSKRGLGLRYGVSDTQVGHIVNNRQWVK